MKMRFLPDKPIETWVQDQFKLGGFVDQIRIAVEYTETPFVFGVLGDWGTGKTSVLNLLKDSFNTVKSDKTYFVPIWFNAWHYENEASIIYPLLYAIKKDYEKRVVVFNTAKDFGKGFLKVVAASTLAVTDVGMRMASKKLIGEAITLEDLKGHVNDVLDRPSEVEKVLNDWADQITTLNEAYQSLIDSYATDLGIKENIDKENIRFVILIDDLDRCLPQTAVTVLENIKNFLAAEKCVYVFGLNPKVVYQGIRAKYQGLEIDGREYLEKILNYSFYVPKASVDDVYSFAVNSLKALLPVSERALHQKRFDAFGSVLKEARFSNPRKVKRIFNHYLLFLDRYTSELDKYYMDNIVKLIILAEYFPNVFLALGNDSSRRRLVSIGASEFKLKEFEDMFGISLENSYRQLVKMRNLVVMNDSADESRYRFSNHYNAVCELLG